MIKRFLLLTLLVFSFTACDKKDKQEAKEEQEAVLKSDPLSQFSMKFINSSQILFMKKTKEGIEFASEEQEGKALLFFFFTPDCTPCKAVFSHMNNLQKKYKDRASVIGVMIEGTISLPKKQAKDEEPERVELKQRALSRDEAMDFINKNQLQFLVSNNEGANFFAKILGIKKLPHFALYDIDAKLINEYQGLVYEEMLDIDMQKALR